VLQVLTFLGLLALGGAILTFNVIYPVFSLYLFLLPTIPMIRLACPEYRTRELQAVVGVLLALVAVVVAFNVPTAEGLWSSPWTFAGGAATAGLMITFWAQGLPRRSRRLQLNDRTIV
jgi:hypothetical protein